VPPCASSKRPTLAAGERGAVDGDQRARTAGASVVDRPGQELLPGARLTEEQHRGAHRRHLRDASQDLLDSRAPPHDVVEAIGPVGLLAEVHVLGFETCFELADLRQLCPECEFRPFPVEGVREDLPHGLHAGHREVRPRPRRPERARCEGADEATTDGDREDQNGFDPGPPRVLAFPAGVLRQIIGQQLDPDGLALEESPVEPWRVFAQEGARVWLDRTRPRVGGTKVRAVGGELCEGRPVRAEARDELAQGALDLRIDPLGLDPGEPGREFGEELLELACSLRHLAHVARPVERAALAAPAHDAHQRRPPRPRSGMPTRPAQYR
jgi:hypothetical protein